jgi:hypothetical protein
MSNMGPSREPFSGGAEEGAGIDARERASFFAAARASGVSFRVAASALFAREAPCSPGGGVELSSFVSGGGAGGGVEGGGRRDANGSGGVLPGSGGSERGATTGAAMPMSVRFPGGMEPALSAGEPLAAAGSALGFAADSALGFAAGSALGRSLVFCSTLGAGMPMSVRLPVPLARAPSGRVDAVSRGPAVAGALEDATRGGALAALGGALVTGRGGALDVVGRGGALEGSGRLLEGLAATGSAAFG